MGIIDPKKDKVVFVQTIKGDVHKYYNACFTYDNQYPDVVKIRSYETSRLFAIYPMKYICFITDVLPETNEHDVRA